MYSVYRSDNSDLPAYEALASRVGGISVSSRIPAPTTSGGEANTQRNHPRVDELSGSKCRCTSLARTRIDPRPVYPGRERSSAFDCCYVLVVQDFKGNRLVTLGRSHCLTERRCSELRVAGRIISGTVVEYGDVADLGAFRETFMPGAFGDVAQLDTTLNILHRQDRLVGRTGGGGVVFRDTPGALLMAATMPATRDGDDALELVRSGVLRGLSVEFRAVKDRFVGDLREIGRAVLDGLGLVDRPAYPGSSRFGGSAGLRLGLRLGLRRRRA